MKSPLRFFGWLILGTALFIGFIIGFRVVLDTTLMTGTEMGVVQTPEEDEPGFDCRIHGNKVCGSPEALVKYDDCVKFSGLTARECWSEVYGTE